MPSLKSRQANQCASSRAVRPCAAIPFPCWPLLSILIRAGVPLLRALGITWVIRFTWEIINHLSRHVKGDFYFVFNYTKVALSWLEVSSRPAYQAISSNLKWFQKMYTFCWWLGSRYRSSSDAATRKEGLIFRLLAKQFKQGKQD